MAEKSLELRAAIKTAADLLRDIKTLRAELELTQKALGSCRKTRDRCRLELTGIALELCGWIEDEETPAHTSHDMGSRLGSVKTLVDAIERPGWRRE